MSRKATFTAVVRSGAGLFENYPRGFADTERRS